MPPKRSNCSKGNWSPNRLCDPLVAHWPQTVDTTSSIARIARPHHVTSCLYCALPVWLKWNWTTSKSNKFTRQPNLIKWLYIETSGGGPWGGLAVQPSTEVQVYVIMQVWIMAWDIVRFHPPSVHPANNNKGNSIPDCLIWMSYLQKGQLDILYHLISTRGCNNDVWLIICILQIAYLAF